MTLRLALVTPDSRSWTLTECFIFIHLPLYWSHFIWDSRCVGTGGARGAMPPLPNPRHRGARVSLGPPKIMEMLMNHIHYSVVIQRNTHKLTLKCTKSRQIFQMLFGGHAPRPLKKVCSALFDNAELHFFWPWPPQSQVASDTPGCYHLAQTRPCFKSPDRP